MFSDHGQLHTPPEVGRATAREDQHRRVSGGEGAHIELKAALCSGAGASRNFCGVHACQPRIDLTS
jgi:hypothetical protein